MAVCCGALALPERARPPLRAFPSLDLSRSSSTADGDEVDLVIVDRLRTPSFDETAVDQ
jgi:hypothetical protein